MRKRKYEYTEKQELEILDAANNSIQAAGVMALILLVWVFVYAMLNYPTITVIGIAIVLIATFIFLNYRAWVVVCHRKNVKSQDNNIEEEK